MQEYETFLYGHGKTTIKRNPEIKFPHYAETEKKCLTLFFYPDEHS